MSFAPVSQLPFAAGRCGAKAMMGALVLGVLHAWAVSNPITGLPLWSLQWVALCGLSGLLQQPVPGSCHAAPLARRGFTLGFAFGLAWIGASLWWLYISMHTYGDLSAPLAVLSVLALSSFLALFYALACAVFVVLRQACAVRTQGVPGVNAFLSAWLFACVWLLADLTRATLMTGLPWASTGYAQLEGPLIGLAPWVGVYGIGFVVTALAALSAHLRAPLLKGLMVLALLGSVWSATHPPQLPEHDAHATPFAALRIRLLQGNIPQNEKFDMHTGVQTALDWYRAALTQAAQDGVDLVIAPETAIPVLPQELPAEYWADLHATFARSAHTAALIGVPLGARALGYTNSVLGLKPLAAQASGSASPYRYDKHHLVPFGEFIPPLFRWFTDLMRIPLGDFARGALDQASFEHQGERFAPTICFEDLFGEELAKRFINPATAPTVLVNVSNMGWFGQGMAIDQHVSMSRMRSIEFDRPSVRATNTGATVVISPQGELTQALARGTRGTLEAWLTQEMRGRTSITPYARWVAYAGLLPLWLLGLFGVLFSMVLAMIRRTKH